MQQNECKQLEAVRWNRDRKCDQAKCRNISIGKSHAQTSISTSHLRTQVSQYLNNQPRPRPVQLNQVKRPTIRSQSSSVCSFQDLPLTFFAIKKAAKFSCPGCVCVCVCTSVSECQCGVLSRSHSLGSSSSSSNSPKYPECTPCFPPRTQTSSRSQGKVFERNLNWKSKMKRKALE